MWNKEYDDSFEQVKAEIFTGNEVHFYRCMQHNRRNESEKSVHLES